MTALDRRATRFLARAAYRAKAIDPRRVILHKWAFYPSDGTERFFCVPHWVVHVIEAYQNYLHDDIGQATKAFTLSNLLSWVGRDPDARAPCILSVAGLLAPRNPSLAAYKLACADP